MRISHLLAAALCAGALTFAGSAVAEEAQAASDREPSAEHGEALFKERCVLCHTGAVSPKPEVLGKLDDATFDEKVKNHAKVGAFDGLTGEDLADIRAWLLTQAAE